MGDRGSDGGQFGDSHRPRCGTDLLVDHVEDDKGGPGDALLAVSFLGDFGLVFSAKRRS